MNCDEDSLQRRPREIDGEKNDRMAFQARADYLDQAIGWLRKGCNCRGGGAVIRFPGFAGYVENGGKDALACVIDSPPL